MRQLFFLIFLSVFRTTSQFVVTCDHPGDTESREERHKRATPIESPTLWPNAVVPYEKVGTLDANLKIDESIAEIEVATCIQFTDVGAEAAVINTLGLGHTRKLLIKDINNGACSSDVGRTGSSGTQDLFLDQDCVNSMTRTPVHEFLHALGYEHEFRRTDRDFYIDVFLDNVESGRLSQFEVDASFNTSKRYDISSIMQYTGRASAKSGTVTMAPKASLLSRVQEGRDNLSGFIRGNDVALSHRDKASINELYNCADCSQTCQNGGYMNSNCDCQCPFGFIGTLCETLDTTGVGGSCSSAEVTSDSGTITPPQESSGFKFDVKCIWRIKGSTSSERVRVKLTSMTIDDLDGGEVNKRDGKCGLGSEMDSLYVYLYGTDVEVYPVSCKSADKTIYLDQWSVSDTNQIIIYWVSDGTYFDFSDFSTKTASVTSGWSLDYEIGTLDGDNNFVPRGGADVTTQGSNNGADPATTESDNIVETTTDNIGGIDATTEDSNDPDATTESDVEDVTTEVNENIDDITTAGNEVEVTTIKPITTTTTTPTTTATTPTTTARTTTEAKIIYSLSISLISVEYVDDYNDLNSPAARQLTVTFLGSIDLIMKAADDSYIRSEVTGLSKGSVVVAYTSYFQPGTSQTTGEIQTKFKTELANNNNQIGQFRADPNTIQVMSGRCDGMNCNQAVRFAYNVWIVPVALTLSTFFFV